MVIEWRIMPPAVVAGTTPPVQELAALASRACGKTWFGINLVSCTWCTVPKVYYI